MPDLAITSIDPNDANAREFRRIQKYGLHVNDFLAITGTKSYPGFGSGNDYTVANWISSGAFANLAAVQAVYPICQATTDYVDWVIIQSAIDFAIYGSLGNSNRAGQKRILRLPAGNFKINRTLHIGYGALGTPPASLNGNGYVTVTIQGEGSSYDPSGNGMTGTTITTTGLSFIGIAVTRGVDVVLRDFTLQGPYDNWLANNNPYRTATWHLYVTIYHKRLGCGLSCARSSVLLRWWHLYGPDGGRGRFWPAHGEGQHLWLYRRSGTSLWRPKR